MDERTLIKLKNKSIIETSSPIAYTGNYILVTKKTTHNLGENTYVTTETTPISLDQIETVAKTVQTQQHII